MSELIFFRESPSGIDYTTFADIPKILSKLIISKTLQTNKRNLIVLSMGLLLIFGGLLICLGLVTQYNANNVLSDIVNVTFYSGH